MTFFRRAVSGAALCALIASCTSDNSSTPVSTETAAPASTAGPTTPGSADTPASADTPPTSSTSTVGTDAATDVATTTSTSVTEPPAPSTELDAPSTVEAFLGHLADDEYDAAAQLVGQGGLSWSQRWDLSGLELTEESSAGLAAALAAWCASGALCERPTSITAHPGDRAGTTDITARWSQPGSVSISGEPLDATATFEEWTYEGEPAVRGLPPLVETTGLDAIARTAGASVVVARAADGELAIWRDGTSTVLPTAGGDGVWHWSDGEYLYWDEDRATGTLTVAADLDGTVVCEALGYMHRLRERDDGTFVASVDRRDDVGGFDGSELPVPNYAVECATGAETPIEPRSFVNEGNGRTLIRVNDEIYEQFYDVEGNGPTINPDGIAINGDDYAAYYTFSPDGSVVAYNDFTDNFSPHLSPDIRVRSTVDAELLWETTLEPATGALQMSSSHLIVEMASEEFWTTPWEATEYLAMFDLASGTRVATIPTTLSIVHLS